LLEKDFAQASADFRTSENKHFFRPVANWKDVLDKLWSSGRNTDGLDYARHIQPVVGNDPSFRYHLAGFLTAKNQLREASEELAKATKPTEINDANILLNAEIQHRVKTGEYTFATDRNNLALINMRLDHHAVFLFEQIRPVLQNAGGDYLATLQHDSENSAVLSIDYRIQTAAEIALGKYAGAIVLLDVKTGDILAAASKTKGVGSEYSPNTSLAMNSLYEPGSIIKLITLAGALEHGIDVSKMFPLQCDGSIKLSNGKTFYDWKSHGTLPDIKTATAVSCNVVFAEIGLRLKPDVLLQNLHDFGFGDKLRGAFLPLELGKITNTDPNEEYISDLSIGLHYVHMTPLHAAMLASSIANGGVCVLPRLLLERRNIAGISFDRQPVVVFRRFMSAKTASVLSEAMQEVIRNPDGTGHRAAINDFPFAIKTGTAGELEKGYNCDVIGFGPLPNPRIAFAIFLEHSGKAEFEGARVTKLFLESIKGYIK
jgi:cell division protein FtsI/penicillin-binding protein 2